MATVNKEHQISADSDRVWGVLADFGNFLTWATGGVGEARIEGEGIGMIRHLDIPGLGQVSERLDQLDEGTRTLGYSMVSEGMAGMAVYNATLKVVPEQSGFSRLIWRGEFQSQAGLVEEEVAIGLAASYDAMAQGLEAFISAQ